MNTGAQLSYSTPLGHRTSTSNVGPRRSTASRSTTRTCRRSWRRRTSRTSSPASRASRTTSLAQGREGAVVRAARGHGVRQAPHLLPAQLAHRRRRGRRHRARRRSTRCFFPLYEIEPAHTTITYDPDAARPPHLDRRTGSRSMGKTKHLCRPEFDDELVARSKARSSAAGSGSRRCTSTPCSRRLDADRPRETRAHPGHEALRHRRAARRARTRSRDSSSSSASTRTASACRSASRTSTRTTAR